MKNPLKKRLIRELLGEAGKYAVIFIFMAATIGFVSGFLVADNSMITAYNNSFEDYNIEDGKFELSDKATEEQISAIEAEDVMVYDNFYVEKSSGESVLRIFANREEVDKACLMKGSMPENADEIAIDRMYADNNKINVGDTIMVADRELRVSGFVALSDYSALFSSNSDTMFDAVKFGVAVMTEEGFSTFETKKITYNYAWKYNAKPDGKNDEKKMSESLMKVIASNATLLSFTPQYENQAIQFTGEDMGSDRSMMLTLLYILIAIMAFVFAVTINNTINKEAAVIGTLRASGYTRGELLRHYLSIPLVVTLVAAVIGNILGYTIFKNVCASMYYGSYSLPTYKTLWNGDAFILTTIIPLIMMIIINIGIIYSKLRISPLKFIRRDLSKSKKKKARRLPAFKFFRRFRMRIIGQNISSYVTLFIGIVFANVLLIFGMMVSPLLMHFQDAIVENMVADYQYILKEPVSTQVTGAEKYSVTSLDTTSSMFDTEKTNVYGIGESSVYVDIDFSDGVFISDTFADKYNLKKGDKVTLKAQFADDKYEFTIDGIYTYPAALSIFMSQDSFNETFGMQNGFFNGYFSQNEITDIDEANILTTITEDDLTKISRQLEVSMGSMFKMVNVFAIVLFTLLIYLLTKIIIEKNANSISMVKILGYRNDEIARLYLVSTTIVVVISTLLSLGISTVIMRFLYRSIMAKMNGWLTFYIEPSIYPKMFLMGVAAYLIVAVLQFRHIKKIPMDEALKNVE